MKEEIDIIKYFEILKRKWKIIIAIFVVAEIVTLIFTLTSTPMYTATATLLPPETLMGREGIITKSLPPIVRKSFPFSLSSREGVSSLVVIAMLKSRRMAQIVVGALNLKNHYNVLSNLSAVGRLRSGLSVSSSKEGWISVTIRDKDPQMAASIANCYVSHLDSLNRELKISLLKPFVTVLDSAIPPTSPSSPRVRLSIVISGIFSLSLGILFAFFLNYIESLKK